MIRYVLWASLALIALLASACGGGFVSGAAQPGSTVLIPIPFGGNLGVQQYGFGGSLVFDDDGEMVVVLSRQMLGVSETVELETLMSFAGEPPVESQLTNATAWLGRQLVIVAEIPAAAPPGSYAAKIYHRLAGNDVLVFDFSGSFTILPNDITVQREDGTDEVISGTSSQVGLGQWTQDPTGVGDVTGYLQDAVPTTSFGVRLLGSVDPDTANYASIEVTYPYDVIDIANVYAIDAGRAHVWFEDDQLGTLTLHGVTFEHASQDGGALKPFRITYTEDQAGVPLDRGDLGAALVVARDETGAALTVPLTIEITH